MTSVHSCICRSRDVGGLSTIKGVLLMALVLTAGAPRAVEGAGVVPSTAELNAGLFDLSTVPALSGATPLERVDNIRVVGLVTSGPNKTVDFYASFFNGKGWPLLMSVVGDRESFAQFTRNGFVVELSLKADQKSGPARLVIANHGKIDFLKMEVPDNSRVRKADAHKVIYKSTDTAEVAGAAAHRWLKSEKWEPTTGPIATLTYFQRSRLRMSLAILPEPGGSSILVRTDELSPDPAKAKATPAPRTASEEEWNRKKRHTDRFYLSKERQFIGPDESYSFRIPAELASFQSWDQFASFIRPYMLKPDLDRIDVKFHIDQDIETWLTIESRNKPSRITEPSRREFTKDFRSDISGVGLEPREYDSAIRAIGKRRTIVIDSEFQDNVREIKLARQYVISGPSLTLLMTVAGKTADIKRLAPKLEALLASIDIKGDSDSFQWWNQYEPWQIRNAVIVVVVIVVAVVGFVVYRFFTRKSRSEAVRPTAPASESNPFG